MKNYTLSGIVGWDFYPAELRDFLADANGDDVEISISSPGGFVSDALEIFNLLRNYPGKVTAVLSGYAMSAASYIPLAADEIVAEDNVVYMIHNVQGGVYGDHNAILKYGNHIAALSTMMAAAYERHTGSDDIRRQMDEETYYYGQEIVDAGFAHSLRVTESHDDEQNYVAFAREAFMACSAKLTENMQAAADDIVKAAALAEVGEDTANRAMAPKQYKEQIMDLATLKNDHPDLVGALSEELMAGLTRETLAQTNPALADELIQAGVAQEMERAVDVRAQLIPGHEALIEQMAADGQSTGADAAKAIVAAEKEVRASAQAAIMSETNQPVAAAETSETEEKQQMKRADFNGLSAAAQRQFVKDGGSVVD